MFALDYQGYVLPELETMALKAQSRYDIYFLCVDDIPNDDTWDRSGDQKRQIFLPISLFWSKRRLYQKITDIYCQRQNKLHYAISNQTAAEIVYTRANSEKENMGLTSW